LFGVAYGEQQRISVLQLGDHESIDSIAWAMTVVPKNGKQEAAKPRLDLALNRYSLQLAEKPEILGGQSVPRPVSAQFCCKERHLSSLP